MDFTARPLVLQAAQGDPAKLALATVDLAYPARPRMPAGAALKEFLEVPPSRTGVMRPSLLPFWRSRRKKRRPTRPPVLTERGRAVPGARQQRSERPRGGPIGPCRAMADDLDGRFRTLSARAVKCFQDDCTAAGRIEGIYHLLCDRNSARPSLRNSTASGPSRLVRKSEPLARRQGTRRNGAGGRACSRLGVVGNGLGPGKSWRGGPARGYCI